MRPLLLLLLSSALLSGSAQAALLLGSAGRSVQCGGDASASDPETGEQIAFDTDGDSFGDGGFGRFEHVLGVSASAGGAGVAGLARQTSTIRTRLVESSDSADLNASAFAPFSAASGVCETHFDLFFDVPAEEAWRLTGSASSSNSGYAQWILYRGVDVVFEFNSDFPFPIDEPITLLPGEHQLTAYSQASGSASDFGTSDGIAGLTFRLEPVPEPGALARGCAVLAALLVLARSRAQSDFRNSIRSRFCAASRPSPNTRS